MTIGAHEACNLVINTRLHSGSQIWGVRVQPGLIASSALIKPCVMFFIAANERYRQANALKKRVILTLSVKGIAEDAPGVSALATALAMQEAITTLLDDSGTQDILSRLPYNGDWIITNVTEGREIFLDELTSVGKMVYHAGHQYEVMMERR
jgi:hypothetical protein